MQDRMGFYRLEEEGRALPLVLRRRKRRLAVCISRKRNFTGVKKGGIRQDNTHILKTWIF